MDPISLPQKNHSGLAQQGVKPVLKLACCRENQTIRSATKIDSGVVCLAHPEGLRVRDVEVEALSRSRPLGCGILAELSGKGSGTCWVRSVLNMAAWKARLKWGVAARVRGLVAVALAVTCLGGGLAACSSSVGDASTGAWGAESGAQSGEVAMSGNYEVGTDGKLRKPAWRIPKKPTYELPSDGHTEYSAQSFGYFFIKTVEYAWNSGDTEAFTQYCDTDTTGCEQVAEAVNKAYTNGGWVDGAEYIIRQSLGAKPYSQSGDEAFAVAHWVTGTENISYDGKYLYSDQTPFHLQWEVHLVPTEKAWKVISLSIHDIPGREDGQ